MDEIFDALMNTTLNNQSVNDAFGLFAESLAGAQDAEQELFSPEGDWSEKVQKAIDADEKAKNAFFAWFDQLQEAVDADVETAVTDSETTEEEK